MAHAPFGDLGRGLSPFPFALIYPQDEHEPLLIRHLTELGVTVERPTELLSFTESARTTDAPITARLRLSDGSEQSCRCAFLAGCDGARSVVRQSLNIGFPGGQYTHLFYVADVTANGSVADGELHVALDDNDFLAIFPLDDNGRIRLVGTIRDEQAEQAATPTEDLSWNDVSKRVLNWINVDIQSVNWFSTYRVHHRVAEHFRSGRAFLLGDAAHIHSPVGGQGMNTGIGDSVNLAWKLASVLRGRAPASILDTYEPERIAFARRLVATTDQAFTAVTSDSDLAVLIRLHIVPHILPALLSSKRARPFLFRTVSQIGVNYRASDLSQGRTGKLHAGDRLPWIQFPDNPKSQYPDNFAPLSSLDWQVHIYSNWICPDIRRLSLQRRLRVPRLPLAAGSRRLRVSSRTPPISSAPTATSPSPTPRQGPHPRRLSRRSRPNLRLSDTTRVSPLTRSISRLDREISVDNLEAAGPRVRMRCPGSPSPTSARRVQPRAPRTPARST